MSRVKSNSQLLAAAVRAAASNGVLKDLRTARLVLADALEEEGRGVESFEQRRLAHSGFYVYQLRVREGTESFRDLENLKKGSSILARAFHPRQLKSHTWELLRDHDRIYVVQYGGSSSTYVTAHRPSYPAGKAVTVNRGDVEVAVGRWAWHGEAAMSFDDYAGVKGVVPVNRYLLPEWGE